MADLSVHSKEELEAAAMLLRERVHQLTMAQEKIRAEVVIHELSSAEYLSDLDRLKSLSGSRPDSEKHAGFSEWGEMVLQDTLNAAPAKAKELQQLEADKQQLIEVAVGKVQDQFKDSVRYELNGMQAPLDPTIVADIVSRYLPQAPSEA